LVDGEIFLTFFISTVDGTCQVRVIKTNEIKKIISDPDDKNIPLYYLRQWDDGEGNTQQMYYADWQAFKNGWLDKAKKLESNIQKAEVVNSGTVVCVLHIAHNRKTGLRGWPIFSAGIPWTKAHTRFREDRSTVAASVAMFVNKLKVRGGSRPIDNLKARLQSSWANGNLETNPAAPAGSAWMQNEGVDLERMPLGTGASDAKVDGESLLQMAALGAGTYPHYFGAGDAYRLATATAMEGPVLRQWSRYQTFWAAQFRKMVRSVLWAKETYPKSSGELQTEQNEKKWADIDISVSTDRLVEIDLGSISDAMSKMLTAITPYMQMGIIPTETLQKIMSSIWLVALQALQVEQAEDIANEQSWTSGVTVPPQPGSDSGRNGQMEREFEDRMTTIENVLRESHEAQEIAHRCPLEGCDGGMALQYPDHKGLLVCATCNRTYDPAVEF
jgi:hypothetical protein